MTALELEDGGCFRKLFGEYCHIKLSASAVKEIGRDPSYVYAVCMNNGNLIKIQSNTKIVPISTKEILYPEKG